MEKEKFRKDRSKEFLLDSLFHARPMRYNFLLLVVFVRIRDDRSIDNFNWNE